MANNTQLLAETIAFHQGLIQYASLLQNESSQEAAARLRTELTIQWGRLAHDLSRLGLSTHYQQFGRTLPVFESALRPIQAWPGAGPNFEALSLSVQALETLIGFLQRKVEGASAERIGPFVLGGLAVLLLTLGAWYFGRRQDDILAAVHSSYVLVASLVFRGNMPWVVSLTATSVVSGGLIANLVHDQGWVGTWRTRRMRATVYSVLLLASLASLAMLARQRP